MKAEITATGHLIVSTETDLELYALRQWKKGWDATVSVTPVEGEASSSILEIRTGAPE